MEPIPEFVNLAAAYFTGLERRFIAAASKDATNLVVIPTLWREFYARAHEIHSDDPAGAAYGLCDTLETRKEEREHPEEALYLAAFRVSKASPIPVGMKRWRSPGGLFAKFEHQGSVEEIGHTVAFIFNTWLPASGFSLTPGPYFERYDHRFDPFGSDSVLEIYLPIT